MDAPTAVVLAAAVGGAMSLVSSGMTQVISSKNINKQFEIDLHKLEMSAILAKRQSALEIIWTALTDYHEFDEISDADRRSFISATLWVSPRIRALCLEALSKKSASYLSAARAELINYVSSLE